MGTGDHHEDKGREPLAVLADAAIRALRTAEGRAEARRASVRLHAVLLAITRGKAALDLLTAEGLERLREHPGLLRVGPATLHDYAREHLGLARSTADAAMHTARGLGHWPTLRAAVLEGELSLRKARALLPLVDLHGEERALLLAQSLTVRDLEARVRAAGKEVLEETVFDQAVVYMAPEQQARVEAGLDLARYVPDTPLAASRLLRLENFAREWLGCHVPCPDDLKEDVARCGWLKVLAEEDAPAWSAAWSTLRQMADEDAAVLVAIEQAWGDGPAIPSPPPQGADAHALHAHLTALKRLRAGWDELFGRAALEAKRLGVSRALGAPGWASYCVDGLGLSAQAVARHMKLETQMRAMPTLRAALRAGRLTFTKACMVGREATPATIDALIDEVAGQPEHDRRVRKNRKRTPCSGREHLYGAREQIRHVIDAILSVQWAALCRGEGVISAGEALARLADHFVEVWKAHVRRPTRLEEQLIAQKDGFCAVPGCSRSLEHKHHIVLRSEGGIDAFPNRIGLCAVHHLAALHKGWLHIRGRNGERLLIQLAEPGPDGQIEAWVIHGDDGPVRAPPEPIHAARGPTWQRAEAGVTA